jgi:hypothetical protein
MGRRGGGGGWNNWNELGHGMRKGARDRRVDPHSEFFHDTYVSTIINCDWKFNRHFSLESL